MTETMMLTDGTKVPVHYDFNAHFDPLPVKNQNQDPTCYNHEHATLCEAALRIWARKTITINPDIIEQEQEGGTKKVWTFPDHPGIEVVTDYSGFNLWDEPAFTGLSRKAAVVKALWLNGVLEGGVSMQHSYERMWKHPEKYAGYNTSTGKLHSLPVLEMLHGDFEAIKRNTWSHAQPIVGYDWTKGMIVQNSWGHRWAMNGRAYVAWDALDKGGIDAAYVLRFGDHAENSLVMPA
jgi:hypothetical protein